MIVRSGYASVQPWQVLSSQVKRRLFGMTRRKKAKGTSFTGYIRIITNVITFGLGAATSSTISLATSAAKATTDLAVQPFNTLYKVTKETYFAPQVTYPDRSWSGMVESLSARKRAWTGESKQLERPRSGSVATFHHVTGGPLIGQSAYFAAPGVVLTCVASLVAPPPRSTSFPAHLAGRQDLSISVRRPNRPELRPLDIPGASLHAHYRGPGSPLSSPLLTPSLCDSPSSYQSSLSSTPRTPRTPPLSASAPSISHIQEVQQVKKGNKGKFGGLEIARVSFWNLVRLGEEEVQPAALEAQMAKRSNMHWTEIIVSCEEDDGEAEDAHPARDRVCYL